MKDNKGETPLHYAARRADRNAAALLLEHGANPLAVDGTVRYPLERVPDGNVAVMELLVSAFERVAPKKWSRTYLLYRAAARGNSALVGHLVDAGADFEVRQGPGQRTPLHEAARAGHADVVAFLLTRGANVGARDTRGATALHYVVTSGPKNAEDPESVVRLLLAGGSNVEAKDRGGKTPLMWAAIAAAKRDPPEKDNYAMVELLLTTGADVNATDGGLWTALHHVAGSDRPGLAALLIAKGARVAMPDRFDKMPLDWFSYRRRHVTERHREMARLLIVELGGVSTADISMAAGTVGTLLHRAAMHGNAELARLLLQDGADVNAQDGRGVTALAVAVQRKHTEAVRALLAANADVNRGTPSALAIARGLGDKRTANLLIRDESKRNDGSPAPSPVEGVAEEGVQNDAPMSGKATCRSCGFVGDIDRFPDTPSIYTDIRCPTCGSTDNQWNDDYRARLRKGMRRGST